MNPWGQPQQPYNPAMAAYYQQQQQAAAYGYQQQQPYQQPQYQPVPGYPPQPQYPYAQPGYAYPPQQTYGAAPAYYPQPVVPAAPVAAPPAPPAPAPAPVAVELPEGAKAPMNVFVGKLPLDVHESCVEALLKQCGGVLKWKRSVGENNIPKAFGFCTFSDAQGALAAVELLNEFDLKGQKIQVKTGQKEQAILDDLITKRRALTSAATQTYSSPPGGVQRSPADEEKLSRLRTFVSSIDTTKPVPAAALASLMPNAPAPGSKEQMIAEEMEKFREKQAQRDKELEDERRRKLQAKVQEAQNLEKTIAASLDSAKKRTLGMKGGPEKRPKLETPAAVSVRLHRMSHYTPHRRPRWRRTRRSSASRSVRHRRRRAASSRDWPQQPSAPRRRRSRASCRSSTTTSPRPQRLYLVMITHPRARPQTTTPKNATARSPRPFPPTPTSSSRRLSTGPRCVCSIFIPITLVI